MVPISILTTKLYIPIPPPGLVARPRLIKILDEGSRCKLTLVSAPAGFGKTTIISDWIQKSNQAAAWISLDDGDNIPARFLSYLITAIQQIDADFGNDILAVVQATEISQLEPLLTLFINQVSSIQNDFVLVFDDYHLISNQLIHEAIEFILEYLPQNMHVVIISRVDLPFSISRLRVGGRLTELRSRDLRFTEGEINSFLNIGLGFDLTAEDIKALETRTEGWIASLQLAMLSLQGREDKSEFISEFSGNHHHVIDYLVDEVMSRQPERIQQFLFQTSILDRFSASICDFVLELSNSNDIIQQLEEGNLFLIPLDSEHIWYRYHHLFADFLRQYLKEKQPASIPELHKRASIWFQQQELFIEAIDHSLSGEDYQRAAQLVESIGPEMMMKSEFDQLTGWLDKLPEDLVNSWPWLCIIRAWICDRWAQFDLGEQYLKNAEAALEDNGNLVRDEAENIIRGQISAIRALYSLKKGNISRSIEYSEQALEYLPMNYFNRGVASFSLGWARKAQGDLSGAIQAYEEGRKSSLAAGNRILAQVIILDIGKIQALQGDLHQAAETMREAISFKYEKSEISIPYASSASISLGKILTEWNELGTAVTHFQEGIEIGVASRVVDAVAVGYASVALAYLAQGDLDAANQACKKAEKMVRDLPDLEAETLAITLDSRVRLLLAQNKLAEAVKFVQERGLSIDAEIKSFIGIEQLVLARVLIHSGQKNPAPRKLSDANKLLTKNLGMAKSAGYINQVIKTLVLKTLAYEAQGRNDQALDSLEEALIMAEPEGYLRTFIDEGDPMKKLLTQISPSSQVAEYSRNLLSAFNSISSENNLQTAQQLLDPLSVRELEVLKLLATELSGPEIADDLMVSLNTFRTHTKNIYHKLGVNNRRMAVSQAEKLNLI